MHNLMEVFDLSSWTSTPPVEMQQKAIQALEDGKIVYFPSLPFELNADELEFLTPAIVNKKAKNVSYDIHTDNFAGSDCQGEQAQKLKKLMKRYALQSRELLEKVFPHYHKHIRPARTSYRPVEIFGRVPSSYRKDDTLLHVDAFPSTPVKGERILRVFTNVNPHGQSRIWGIGEPLPHVVKKFAPLVKKPFPGSAYWQKLLKITRDYRTLYDHYIL